MKCVSDRHAYQATQHDATGSFNSDIPERSSGSCIVMINKATIADLVTELNFSHSQTSMDTAIPAQIIGNVTG